MCNYIKAIKVNQVRHLRDFVIDVVDKTNPADGPVHLMLTGRNGCGKTSMLKYLVEHLKTNARSSVTLSKLREIRDMYLRLLQQAVTEEKRLEYKRGLLENQKREREWVQHVEIVTENELLFHEQLKSRELLVAYYPAQRISKFSQPNAPQLIEVGPTQDIQSSRATTFLMFLVHLKAQRSMLRDEGKEEAAEAINTWFIKFENILRSVFNDKQLKLDFNPGNYEFTIISREQQSPLTALADGYAALLDIVADLILKMQSQGKLCADFNQPGIVLIDEVETHLHMELQALVMPLLTSLFPNIQFIVTTHSPFVLSSIENALAFDLETQQPLDNADEYSYDSLAEGYFGVQIQPDIVRRHFERLNELIEKTDKTEDEMKEQASLINLLKRIPKHANAALNTAMKQLLLRHHL